MSSKYINPNLSSSVVEGISEAVYQQIKKGLNFDNHIEATITAIIDSSLGIYRVKYQDATFNARTENNIKYQKNDRVLVLIPNGDFNSPNKMITGTVSRDMSNYGGKSNFDDLSYEKIGINLCKLKDSQEVLQMCSYKTYSPNDYKDGGILSIPLISLNEQFTYITNATHLQLKFKLKTKIPANQKKAAFGIEMKLKFAAREDLDKKLYGEEYIKTYRLEPHNLVGANVYNLPYYMEQNFLFELGNHAKNFIKIEEAYLYVSNYFNKEANKSNDIFIRDLEILALNASPKTSDNEYRLILTAPKGQYFLKQETDKEEKLSLQAKIYLNGQEASTLMKTAKFYWFKEDLSITEASARYLNYGGSGWLCMNKGGPKEGDSSQYVWEAGSSSCEISENIILSKKRGIKCVAIVNSSIILSASIIMQKPHGLWDLSVSSSEGLTLKNTQKTTLTCKVVEPKDEKDKPDANDFLEYTWQKPDEYNNLQVCGKTSTLNTLEVSGSDILADQVYKCGVMWHQISQDKDGKYHDNSQYVGTAELQLSNYDNSPKYSLFIINGDQLFKYDNNGISPAHRASGYSSQKINPLSFEIRDRKGNKITNPNISKITWQVPSTDTFLVPTKNYYVNEKDEIIEDNGVKNGDYTHFSIANLNFDIQSEYKINYSNNQILLSVEFTPKGASKPEVLSQYTHFIFTKDGAIGMSGAGGVCWIEDPQSNPNKKYLEIDNTNADKDGKVSLLYDSGKFKVLDKYYPQKEETLLEVDNNKWISLHRTSECSNLYIKTNISKKYDIESAYFNFKKDVVGNKNQVWFNGTSLYPFANFIQLNLKINGKVSSSVMPIVATKYDYDGGLDKREKWSIRLKQNTGFLFVNYESNGQNPTYDTDLPFELEVLKDKKSMVSEPNLKIEWKCYGNLTIDKATNNLAKNKCVVKPKANYTGYGYANYVYARLWYKDTFLGGILIPIYFYINQNLASSYNNWTGNGISVSPNTDTVVNPQAGTGSKNEETENFTGVIMGTRQSNKDNKTVVESGLLGYCNGEQTIFFDADSGSSILGADGQGQIIIDYKNNQAKIISKNYKKTTNSNSGTGMLIDLIEPSIAFGNNRFSIDKNGKMKAVVSGLDYLIDKDTSNSDVDNKWRGQSLLTLMANMQNTITTMQNEIENLRSEIRNLKK